MEAKKRWTQLSERWSSFLSVILDPLVVLLLAGSIALGVFLVYQKDTAVVAVLTVLFGLASGLAGEMVSRKWAEMTEEKLILARGQLSVRGLKLLLGHLAGLEKRVSVYLKRHSGTAEKAVSQPPDVISICLEEILEKCALMQGEVLASIENWTDIVPEAETQIELLAQLRTEVSEKSEQLGALAAHLAEVEASADASKEEVSRLRRERDKMERELHHAEREAARISSGGLVSASSYISAPASGTTSIRLHGGSSSFLDPAREVIGSLRLDPPFEGVLFSPQETDGVVGTRRSAATTDLGSEKPSAAPCADADEKQEQDDDQAVEP